MNNIIAPNILNNLLAFCEALILLNLGEWNLFYFYKHQLKLYLVVEGRIGERGSGGASSINKIGATSSPSASRSDSSQLKQ